MYLVSLRTDRPYARFCSRGYGRKEIEVNGIVCGGFGSRLGPMVNQEQEEISGVYYPILSNY